MVTRSELCAMTKSQELKEQFWHILSQLTLFTTMDLAKGWMAHTGTRWVPFKKSFQLADSEHCRTHSRIPTSLGIDSLVLFSNHSMVCGGIRWLILGLFSRASTEQSTRMGRLPLKLVLLCDFRRTDTIPKAFVSRGEPAKGYFKCMGLHSRDRSLMPEKKNFSIKR